MEKKRSLLITLLENFTLAMIVMVLIQTFMEDLSVYLGWPLKTIDMFRTGGFFFDLFFSIEFIVRIISAATKGEAKKYFLHKNGWIDLLASIPLLLFVSGPFFLGKIMGSNMETFVLLQQFSLLKMIKAIRVTRILRFLRVLKIFGKIKNVRSSMAQRHVSTILTMSILTIITFFLGISIMQQTGLFTSAASQQIEKETSIIGHYSRLYGMLTEKDYRNTIKKTASFYPQVAAMTYKGEVLYEFKILTPDEMTDLINNNTNDLVWVESQAANGNLHITFYRGEQVQQEAFGNLVQFGLIMAILIVLLVLYTAHFALTVSDPIFIMRMGFEKKDYTLAVKIPKTYAEDDIFILADDYNNRWLPAKMRTLSNQEKTTSVLTMENVFGGDE